MLSFKQKCKENGEDKIEEKKEKIIIKLIKLKREGERKEKIIKRKR